MNQAKKYHPLQREIFHVHTWRCKHAGTTQDYEYVERAIALNAPRIVFTDHCPFPGDELDYRMDYDQLPEYVEAIGNLKKQYAGRIEILCGLEVEYFPKSYEYYKSLKESGDFDLLILGQHFFQYEDGHYDYKDADRTNAYIGICDATVEGIKTGFFDVLAHPDRAFRKKEYFDDLAQACAKKVIDAAIEADMYLEKNFTSMRSKKEHLFWPEFWEMLPDGAKILYGFDAHSVEDIDWENAHG